MFELSDSMREFLMTCAIFASAAMILLWRRVARAILRHPRVQTHIAFVIAVRIMARYEKETIDALQKYARLVTLWLALGFVLHGTVAILARGDSYYGVLTLLSAVLAFASLELG